MRSRFSRHVRLASEEIGNWSIDLSLHRILGNMGVAALAQGVSLAVSLLTSLLVPKVLGVSEFGYWQLFIFYFNYAGAFQLGLNDGIYLIKGGQTRKTIDKREVSSECVFGLLFQTTIALLIVGVVVAMQPEPQRLFVTVACAILMPLYNLACLFQYLLQAIDETRAYARSIMLDRAVMALLLLLLVCVRVESFETYVWAFCAGKVAQLVYLLIWSKDILTRDLLSVKETFTVSRESIRVGIKLMIANLASTLILGMMRFVIDGCWGLETFGKVSLALSMANFFLTFVTQVALVLFPALRRMDSQRVSTFFSAAQNALELLIPAVLLLYLPVKLILNWWLPDYTESFMYLGLLLPLCLFDGKMNALYSTMFKVCRKEATLLALNLTTMTMSAAAASLGAFVFHNLYFVLISGTITVMLRSTVAGAILSCDVMGRPRVSLGEIVLSIVFVAGTTMLSDVAAFVLCAGAYAIYLLTRKASIKQLSNNLARGKKLLESEGGER